VQVRRAAVARDVEAVRLVRLRALADAPEAFGSTLGHEQERTPDGWRRWLSGPGAAFLLIAEGPEPLGLAAGYRPEDDPSVVHLVSMWVDPAVRRRGGAALLVEAVLAWSTEAGVGTVRLHVVEGNEDARRVYERHRFRLTGRSEVRARDGLVEVELERALDREPAC